MKALEISQQEKEKRAAVSTALLKALSEIAFAQPERNIHVPIGDLCILTGITKKRIWDLLSSRDLITEDEAELLTSVFSNSEHFKLKSPPDFTEILYPSVAKPAIAQREFVDDAFRRSYGPFEWPKEILRDDYEHYLKAEVDKAQLYILRRSNDGATAYNLVSGHLMGWACQELAKYTGLTSRAINLYLDPRRAESLTIKDAAKLDNVFKSFYPNGVSPLKQLGIHGELRPTSHHDLPTTEHGYVIAGTLQGLVREWGIKHLKELTGVDMREALEIDDSDLAGRNFLKHVSDEGFAKLNAAFKNSFVQGKLPERTVDNSEFLPLRRNRKKGGPPLKHYTVPPLSEEELAEPFISIGKRINALRTQHNRYLKLNEIEGISEDRVSSIEHGVPLTLEEADKFDAAFKKKHTISGEEGTIRALVEQAQAHLATVPDREVPADEHPAPQREIPASAPVEPEATVPSPATHVEPMLKIIAEPTETSTLTPAVEAAITELRKLDKNTPARALATKMEIWAKRAMDRTTLGIPVSFFTNRTNFLRKAESASNAVIEQLAEDNNLPLEEEVGGMPRRRIMKLLLEPASMTEDEAGKWDALLLTKGILKEDKPTVTDYVKAVKVLKERDSERLFGHQNGAGTRFPGS